MTNYALLVKTILETENTEMLKEIFGTENKSDILDKNETELYENIRKTFLAKDKCFKYGDIVVWNKNSEEEEVCLVLSVHAGKANASVKLATMQGVVTVFTEHIRKTYRRLHIWRLKEMWCEKTVPISDVSIQEYVMLTRLLGNYFEKKGK